MWYTKCKTKWGLLSVALLTLIPLATTAHDTQPDVLTRRLRLGPFFEYQATEAGGSFWAIRPFYTKVREPQLDTTLTDVLWPLNTFHRDRERLWWRIMLAYGFNDDLNDRDNNWRLAILPFYFQGRTRLGEDYWAFFPFYGHIPQLFTVNDINFTLFPFYFNYELNGVKRVYTPWPFYSRLRDNPKIAEQGVFPFWSTQENYKYMTYRKYRFWPIWNSAEYHDDHNPGSSYLLFPLYGKIDRKKEFQRLILPPFFSYAETDSARRWRLPWPFYEKEENWNDTTTTMQRRSWWPIYGYTRYNQDNRRNYALWPFYWSSHVAVPERREQRYRVFPFYTDEQTFRGGSQTPEIRTARYTRVWPLWVRESTPDSSRLRVFEFNLIRHSGAIERNWAPFWTLYERRRQPDGQIKHDLLWGLIKWTTHKKPEAQKIN